ncbi:MAG: baseplate J/gp47 family protein [Anaerolineae bacterium]|nr:baseplate J/gp47 family protein [Anaerolineae bacterium]
MPVQTISFSAQDSPAIITDQLRSATSRNVLLNVPQNAPLWTTEPVEWARLRTQARALGLTLGIVTHNPWIWAAARQAGLRVFMSQTWGERAIQRRRWWRRTPPRLAGAATIISAEDRHKARAQMRTLPRWRRWLQQYAIIIVFVITLAILAVTAVYVLPGAQIRLQPTMHTIAVQQQVVVDPRLDSAEAGGASIPGRLLVVDTKWQTSAPTSGLIELPSAAARGNVIFANRLPEAVTIPAGTRVSTSGDQRIVFQTVDSAELPVTVNSQVEVAVVAIEPGISGNIEPGQINRVAGALATQVRVRNAEPTEGGAVRAAPAVAQIDIDNLNAHIREHLVELARADMRDKLQPGEELVDESVRIVQIIDETTSHFIGEETGQLSAEIRAILYGTAVASAPAHDLMQAAIDDAVWQGYTLQPGSMTMTTGNILGVDNEGRVNLELQATARIVADLSLHEALLAIRGQEIDLANVYLAQSLPLESAPEITVWPQWHTRLPYLPVRMVTQVEVSGGLESTPTP